MAVGATASASLVRGPIGPLRGLLERFRRSSGVPQAVSDDVAAELAPLFALLDDIEVEAAAIRDAGARDAREIMAGIAADVELILEDGEGQAAAASDEARASALEAAEGRAAALLEEARVEASLVRARAAERTPVLVSAVLACIRASPR